MINTQILIYFIIYFDHIKLIYNNRFNQFKKRIIINFLK